jgi:hypothetical protein
LFTKDGDSTHDWKRWLHVSLSLLRKALAGVRTIGSELHDSDVILHTNITTNHKTETRTECGSIIKDNHPHAANDSLHGRVCTHPLAPNAVRLILRACPRRVWSHTKLFTLPPRASLTLNTSIESSRKLTDTIIS